MQEVMNHIRTELGHNAVILNSKVINRNGFLGLFKKKTFEVVATIDDDLVDSKKTTYTKVNIDSIPHIKRESSESTVPYKNEDGSSSSKEIMKELHSMKQMLTLDSKYNLYPEILREIHQKLVNIELDKQLIDKLMEYLLNKWRNDSRSAEMTRELLLQLVHSYLHEQVKGLSGNKEQLFKRKYINIRKKRKSKFSMGLLFRICIST